MFLLVLHIALYARLADAFLCWNDRLLLLVHLGRRVEMSADNAFDDQGLSWRKGLETLMHHGRSKFALVYHYGASC